MTIPIKVAKFSLDKKREFQTKKTIETLSTLSSSPTRRLLRITTTAITTGPIPSVSKSSTSPSNSSPPFLFSSSPPVVISLILFASTLSTSAGFSGVRKIVSRRRTAAARRHSLTSTSMEFGVCSSSRDEEMDSREEMELDSKNKNSIETETSEETTCLSICQSKVGGEAVEKFLVPGEPSLWYSVQFTLTRLDCLVLKRPYGFFGLSLLFLFNVAGLKMVVCESTPLVKSGEQALLCDVQGCRKLMFSINFSAARILK
ncbi:hypothetical protein HID58_074185 [Brassica napus]|uniref:Uncharacterized protein n=1 Tax=Brassica napus TaxID=3708 RepID=A0ABQ7YIQ6_BRANA|nr:hypothetical protein HID58_074185 [Brassica napus]